MAQYRRRPRAGSLPDPLVRELEDRLTQEQVEARLPSLVGGTGARRGPALVGSPGLRWSRRGPARFAFDAISDRLHFKNVHRRGGDEAARRGCARPERYGASTCRNSLIRRSRRTASVPHFGSSGRAAGTMVGTDTPGASFADLVSSSARPQTCSCAQDDDSMMNLGFGILGELVARKVRAPFGMSWATSCWRPSI